MSLQRVQPGVLLPGTDVISSITINPWGTRMPWCQDQLLARHNRWWL